MTLLYRAIWQDDRDRIVDAAEEAFAGWMREKGIVVEMPDEGHAHGHREAKVLVRRALSGDVEAAQFELSEERHELGERWTTRLTVIDGPPGDRWLWVDLERVADAGSERPLLAAPKLVRNLLKSGRDARVDQVRIAAFPLRIAPPGLAGLIRNPTRTLPLVVFSEGSDGYTPLLARSEEVARRLAAATQVMMLPATQTEAFKAAIGDELAVWGGAARVYLPNAGPRGLRPERHRFLRHDQLTGGTLRPVSLLSSMLSAVVTARRPPAVYDRVRRELRLGRSKSDAELLAVAEAEIERLTGERNALKDLDTIVDLEETVTEVARLRNQLQLIVAAPNRPDRVEEASDLACEPATIAEAVALARDRLGCVVIPPGVERDIDELDRHICSASWADLIWRGLRALHCYAEADFDGNFKQWCLTSGHAWAWPAGDKKLAMRESETVEANARLAEQRRFPVDPRVDPSGSVVMWAHLKVATGGGPMAPRIYFHDDSRGATGRIHIGFIGPHKYVENTRTN